MPATPKPLWRPSAAAVEASNLTAYTDWLRAERGVDVTTYPDLWRWSVSDLDAFWNSIFDYFRVEYDGERGPALGSRETPGTCGLRETSDTGMAPSPDFRDVPAWK
jgi:acetoacetyl-CoA synthetase